MLSAKEMIPVGYMGMSGEVQVECRLKRTGGLLLVGPIERFATIQAENIYQIGYSAMTECTVWEFSRWVVATRPPSRNPAHALYPIPRGDHLVGGL
jgi:hypothetical protein